MNLETMPPFEAIHGTANIGKFLGISRAAVGLALQGGRLHTTTIAGRSCATREEIYRFWRAEFGIDQWENEGGPARD